MPKVSVVIPFRNCCLTVEQAVDSVIKQNLNDVELVAVLDRDDGTIEGKLRQYSDAIGLTIVKSDFRRFGFPEMLNQGVSAASGPLIARLDDDDISHVQRLKVQSEAFYSQPSTVLVTGWADALDVHGHIRFQIRPSLDPSAELLWDNVICHSSVMFPRDLVLDLGGYRRDLDGCEDYDLWLRLSTVGQIYAIQETVVDYFLNPQGMTKTPLRRRAIANLNESRRLAQQYQGVPQIRRLIQNSLWTTKNVLRGLSLQITRTSSKG